MKERNEHALANIVFSLIFPPIRRHYRCSFAKIRSGSALIQSASPPLVTSPIASSSWWPIPLTLWPSVLAICGFKPCPPCCTEVLLPPSRVALFATLTRLISLIFAPLPSSDEPSAGVLSMSERFTRVFAWSTITDSHWLGHSGHVSQLSSFAKSDGVFFGWKSQIKN